jgi:hypothetical protein
MTERFFKNHVQIHQQKCLTNGLFSLKINYATPLPGFCLSLIATSPRGDDWATKARQLWQTKNVTVRRSINLSFNYPARPVRLSHGCAFCSLVPGKPGANKKIGLRQNASTALLNPIYANSPLDPWEYSPWHPPCTR